MSIEKKLATQNERIKELIAQRSTLCIALRTAIRTIRRGDVEKAVDVLWVAYTKAGPTESERMDNLAAGIADIMSDPDPGSTP